MTKGVSSKKVILFFVALTLISAFLVCVFWQGLTTTEYSVKSHKITKDVKIALVSDLHSSVYGKNQNNLIEKIDAFNPDIILLPGDIADEKTSYDGVRMLLSVIGKKYPCYYVTGNHEFWTNEIEYVKNMVSSYGVNVLSGTICEVTVNNQTLLIGGVDDPVGLQENEEQLPEGVAPPKWLFQLESIKKQNDENFFSILLSHRPELVEAYSESGFDLVVSGHAHGGQVIVPFLINGVYAPHQGLFPDYAGGLYNLGQTDMIVSRGLCVDEKPRVFNPPELVFINIEPK